MVDLKSFQALCCGTCGFAFEDEEGLRRHQETPDEDGELHDGEPWGTVTISVGDETTWEPTDPRAFCHVKVTRITRNADGEVWIGSEDKFGRKAAVNLSRWVEATKLWERS